MKLGKAMEFVATDDGGNSYDAIRFKITKGSSRRPQPGKSAAEGQWLVVPILPELREILTATPSGHLTYLVTKFGKPSVWRAWVSGSATSAMQRVCRTAPHMASGSMERRTQPKPARPSINSWECSGGMIPSKRRHTRVRQGSKSFARSSMHLLSSNRNKKAS